MPWTLSFWRCSAMLVNSLSFSESSFKSLSYEDSLVLLPMPLCIVSLFRLFTKNDTEGVVEFPEYINLVIMFLLFTVKANNFLVTCWTGVSFHISWWRRKLLFSLDTLIGLFGTFSNNCDLRWMFDTRSIPVTVDRWMVNWNRVDWYSNVAGLPVRIDLFNFKLSLIVPGIDQKVVIMLATCNSLWSGDLLIKIEFLETTFITCADLYYSNRFLAQLVCLSLNKQVICISRNRGIKCFVYAKKLYDRVFY